MIRLSRRTTIKIRARFFSLRTTRRSLFHVEVAISGFFSWVCFFTHTMLNGFVSTGQITTTALALQQSPLWHSIIKAQLFTTSSSRAGYLPIYYSVNLCRCTRIRGLISRARLIFRLHTPKNFITYNLRLYVRGALSRTQKSTPFLGVRPK